MSNKLQLLDAVAAAGFIDTVPTYKKVKGGVVEVKNQTMRGIKRANLKRSSPQADKLVKGIHLTILGVYRLFLGFMWVNLMLLHGFRIILEGLLGISTPKKEEK